MLGIENPRVYMAIKNISEIGSKVIRSKAQRVKDARNSQIRKLIRDLTDTMRHENLVGIAAPQIGESLQIFLIEVRKTTYRKSIAEKDALRVFINPKIISHSRKSTTGFEGCGSVASAKIFGPVKRYYSVEVRAQDQNGKIFQLNASGFLACVIQHEIDHLSGIVFIDRVTNTKLLLGRKEYIRRK